MESNRPKPQSINPVEWAEHNAQESFALSQQEMLRRQMAAAGCTIITALPVLQPRVGVDLILEPAIRRAVADLEGQGGRSDRIALQLLTALAQYAKETGR